jgi:membrane carboxypeptidase/penicillin-binding protein
MAAFALYCWLYLYSADLPSLAELSRYDPATASAIHDQSPNGVDSLRHVVPSDRLGKYLLNAVVAAEGQPEWRGPIRATAASLFSGAQPQAQMYSWQLARGLVPHGRTIRRQINELRLADEIQRHFDQRQVMTIYMNRVYLGENVYGVEDGAMRYFGKRAADLSLNEAALLAGLIRSPGRDSPIDHPDRAVERRNWVIDQMISHGSVSQKDAQEAKTGPLIIRQTANSEATYDWNRCALKVISHGSSADTTSHARPWERSTKQTPVIAFEVLESGEVKNAVIVRSSGIADIDNYVLVSIRSMRYNLRPPGCGIIDSKAAVNVDF